MQSFLGVSTFYLVDVLELFEFQCIFLVCLLTNVYETFRRTIDLVGNCDALDVFTIVYLNFGDVSHLSLL